MKQLCLSFLQKTSGKRLHDEEERAVGRITHRTLCEKDTHALEEAGFSVTSSTLPVFPRFKHSSGVFQSRPDNCKRKCDSSVCLFQCGAHNYFGSIRTFCFPGHSTTPVAIVRMFERTGEHILETSRFPFDTQQINSYVHRVK